MTDETRTLREYDRRYVWHPFTQMREWVTEDHPVIVRGEGCWLIDSEGNRYLDGVASIWTNVHGHCHPYINGAIREQLERIGHSTLLGLINDQSALLAKRLVEIAPPGLTRVFYSDDGSTAMEIALKMAYQYQVHRGMPARSRFVSFSLAYHGDTIGAVSVGGIDIFHSLFRPLLFPTLQAPAPYCYRCPLGKGGDPEECGLACLKELERLLGRESPTLAGVVIEPLVQGAGGMIVHPDGFLRGVRQLCDRYGLLLIADEVAVGFGRTGTMFASEQEGVTPDIMALSKGISGGYLPLAATLATDRIYDQFLGGYEELKTFFHGHTFTGNPLACAAANASLDLFERERLLETLPPKISRIEGHLRRIASHPHVGEVRQRGMIAAIELVKNRETKEGYGWGERIGWKVCLDTRPKGLFLRPLGNVIVIFPPLVISPDEIDFMMTTVEESIDRVTSAA